MSNRPEKPPSPALVGALQAVARMKGDTAIAWMAFRDEGGSDDRYATAVEPAPQQGWKPAGR